MNPQQTEALRDLIEDAKFELKANPQDFIQWLERRFSQALSTTRREVLEEVEKWANEKLAMFGGLWVDERDHEFGSESRLRVNERNKTLLEVRGALYSSLQSLKDK